MKTTLFILLCSITLWAQEEPNRPQTDLNLYPTIEKKAFDPDYMSREQWKSINKRKRGLKTGGGLLIGSGSLVAPLGALWIVTGMFMEHNEISAIGLVTMSAGTGMIIGGVHMVRKGKAIDREYPFLSKVDIIPIMDISNRTYGTTVTINF